MPGKITNQVVVVTGGTRGIGLEFVSRLLGQGNTVVATGRAPSTSPGLAALAVQYGDRLIPTALEVSDPGSIATWAADLKQGGRVQHIDVLINNAAVSLESHADRLADLEPDKFTVSFTANALGPLLVVKELVKQGLLGGATPSLAVHISSFAGSFGKMGKTPTFYFQYFYRASKSALNMLVLMSSHELPEKNITSVLLHPGRVTTDMNPTVAFCITTEESVTGQLAVLESERPLAELNGKFLSYTGEEVPW